MARISDKNNRQVITNEVRLSYAHIFEPNSINGSEPKYSASFIIPKEDTETVALIKEAIENAKQEGINILGGKIPKGLKQPLRDGDEERDDEAYAGCYFVNASSKTKPGIVDKYRRKIEDSTEVYSGCYVLASLSFYAFNTNGNKGIACGLNNIMKVRDGEPLSGRTRAEDDFADAFESAEDDFLD